MVEGADMQMVTANMVETEVAMAKEAGKEKQSQAMVVVDGAAEVS